jgi:hypothetical protein
MATSEYYATYLLTMDSDFKLRVSASAAQEGGLPEPDPWVHEHRWQIATSPGWAAKAAAAIDAGNTEWGKDPAVITDGDILAVVQPMVAGG